MNSSDILMKRAIKLDVLELTELPSRFQDETIYILEDDRGIIETFLSEESRKEYIDKFVND